MLETTLWVALGGAIGSVSRFWLALVFDASLASTFPWATVAANITGSFAIGLVAAVPMSPLMRQFLMVGVLGGYTTFSAFSLQTLVLVQDGEWPKAVANVLASVILCLAAVWLGHALAAGLRGGEA
ncbi:MAG: fluoride efflux transporter CrcB [Alphaproteobacteria bacterium]|nr:fluoride efflux transporter CrcB [Alphaproteobacteria bacterium]